MGRYNFLARVVLIFFGLAWGSAQVCAAEIAYFGVLNQRSITLTAELWNPILRYVSAKSGVPLRLKMGKTALETTQMTLDGEFDFVYTNHLFTPERDQLGYRVIARFNTPGISGQIVVQDHSPFQTLSDLQGKKVTFPSHNAFAGFMLPMDALQRAGIPVSALFAGNQELAMGRLALGTVAAAGVNSQVMANFAVREGLKYRVLYSSEPYLDLPVMAHPRVALDKVEQVQKALLGMGGDPEGRRILQAAADLLKSRQVREFIVADNTDYENYRRFYRTTKVGN
ncbi:MAG: phosphate/phosphite/phosphonate ABC transporter substrate-binding protein [Burkholderiaceae bacterium]